MTIRHQLALHLASPVTALLLVAALASALRASDTPAPSSAKPRGTAPRFRIPEHVIRQARELAATESRKTVDLKSRRPAGLQDLSSPAAIDRAVAAAIRRLENPQEVSLGMAQLSYLGDAAFDQLVAGTRSPNKHVASHCCTLLGRHGHRAVPALIAAAKLLVREIRVSAVTALAGTMDPDAYPILIAALQGRDESVRSAAIQGLVEFRDLRAIPKLRQLQSDKQFESQIRDAIQRLYAAKIHSDKEASGWPAGAADIALLCANAHTLKGESFGATERNQLLSHIKSKNFAIRSGVLQALISLQARELIPAIIKDAGGELPILPLLNFGGAPVVDYFTARFHASDPQTRRTLFNYLAFSGRWATPLLISLLDDPEMAGGSNLGFSFGIATKSPSKGISSFAQPDHSGDANQAFFALVLHLGRHGLPQRVYHGNDGPSPDVFDQVAGVKDWWTIHGKAYFAGKSVPNPNLSIPSPGQYQAIGTTNGGETTNDF